MSRKIIILLAGVLAILSVTVTAQDKPTQVEVKKEKVLDAVATAHLDTQWRWTVQDSINKFIPNTLKKNFALFEKYPDYVFSFEGAIRYQFAKEYYPEDYAKLKEYIAKGRWRVTGSAVDAGDVNLPTPEELIRQILYANHFFKKEFNKESVDIFLPDCFGFGYALPSVAAHCGLKGFSTQKLSWGSSIPLPFDIGMWEGPDGQSIVAALNPDGYTSKIDKDLSMDEGWLKRIDKTGDLSGVYVGYKYFGVGDQGGAPDDKTVEWLEKSIHGSGPIKVVSAGADEMYRNLTLEQIQKLPRYKGELLLKTHGVGCYTSHAEMKKMNRKNALLANAAERASVAADWMGGITYPREKFTENWERFLWHQFHDDITGTSIPQAYVFSQNDEILAQKGFNDILNSAVGAVVRNMDTRTKGTSVVVYNPLSIQRKDIVEAKIIFPNGAPDKVHVVDPVGLNEPCQIIKRDKNELNILFMAQIPSLGFKVYDIRSGPNEGLQDGSYRGIETTNNTIDGYNLKYKIKIDNNGDISSIFDKEGNFELLSSPIRLEMLEDTPTNYPAWEIRYEDVTSTPRSYVGGPAKIKIPETGPLRVCYEITRETEGSIFKQDVRYYTMWNGIEEHPIEVVNTIDWKTPNTLLKVRFPLTVSDSSAVYDLGLGTIERGNNTPNLYEVPAQQWANVSRSDDYYGVAILNDCKYGWDKPDDTTLRLTLLHSPNPVHSMGYADQSKMDFGRHKFTYSIYGHNPGAWNESGVNWEAAKLNQPLLAYQVKDIHAGSLGKEFSLLQASSNQVEVTAVKKAEDSGDIIVRVQEKNGKNAKGIALSFAGNILSAMKVDGQEKVLGPAEVKDGTLVFDVSPYQLQSFAIKVGGSSTKLTLPESQPIKIGYNADGVSLHNQKGDGDFDGMGNTYPAELLPSTINCEGIRFDLASTMNGKKNIVSCNGQKIAFKAGKYSKIYFLASATEENIIGDFMVGDIGFHLPIEYYSSDAGQWFSRVNNGKYVDTENPTPPFTKTASVAWVGTHRHLKGGEVEPYIYCYLFKYGLDIPKDVSEITLPKNDKIKIFAVSLANNPNEGIVSANLAEEKYIVPRIKPESGIFLDSIKVSMGVDDPLAVIRYTLDGTNPVETSHKYAGPIEIKDSVVVKAKAFSPGQDEEMVKSAVYTKTVPQRGLKITPIPLKLTFEYYEGNWKKLPDFSMLTSVKSGVADFVDIGLRNRNEHFGLSFSGYIKIPKEGIYTFYLDSDDGSRMLLDSQVLIDNDGLHSEGEKSSQIALEKGIHSIRVDYFQGSGDYALDVSYEGPGLVKQVIPKSAYSN